MAFESKITLVFLLNILCNSIESYSTYPRRYNRDLQGGYCPHQCRCMALNQRGTRDLFGVWGSENRWSAKLKGFEELTEMMSDSPTANARSMVCQGLRRLPSPIPSDVTKVTIYGDSSSNVQEPRPETRRGRRVPLISDTQIRYIDTNSFRGSIQMLELTMSGNNIGILYPYTFKHLRSLEVLNFPNNNVRHLSAAVFTGLSRLKQVRLSDNMFRFLPSTVFKNLQELRVLNLNGNKIRYIQRNLFAPLRNLEILDLSRNNITDMFDEVFDKNTEIKELLLNGNRLWKIRPRWFENLSNLRSLSLRGNVIRTIEPKSFMNLINLEELLLSANHIQDIKTNAFQNLRDLRILDLATNDITDIPNFSFFDLVSLEELFLGGNKLSTIKNGTFKYVVNLQRLDLSRNVIDSIEKGAFGQLRSVYDLDISHNKLRKIEKHILFGVEDLKELNLEHNFINILEEEAFKTTTDILASKLSVLNLQGNDLKKIGPESFQGLLQLKSLDIGNNRLKRVHSMAFSSLSNLRKLTLNDNRLRNINNGLFSNLRRLLHLDLSTNKFQSVPDTVFSGITDLEYLNIAFNGIHEISEKSFQPLQSLSTLNVKGNKLLNFNFSWISNLPQLSTLDLNSNYLFWIDIPQNAKLLLKELDLSSNNLKTIPTTLKSIMTKSGYVDITSNPFECDCKMRWLLDPSLRGDINIDRKDEVICKSPDKLHGRKLMFLMDSDLSCSGVQYQSDQPSLICDAMTFQKKSSFSPRLGNKIAIKRHATIYDSNRQPIANGVVIGDGWILTIGSKLATNSQSTTTKGLNIRIGRAKKYQTVASVLPHPLVAMKKYNVALLRYISRDVSSKLRNSCFLSKKQYESISKIIPRVTITTRISSKKKFSKLKPRKGRLSSSCLSENFICSVFKSSKQNRNNSVLIDGSPLYLGQPGDSRMAGIGVQIKRSNNFEYVFIPVWSVSDWINTVMTEYGSKCVVTKRGPPKCDKLKLPSVEDMMNLLTPMEEH